MKKAEGPHGTLRQGPPPADLRTLVVLPHPPRDRFHPVLQLELLLLQRRLLDLLFVAQDRLVVELAQAGLVLVMLLVQPTVFLVLKETLRREGTGVMGHRHLRRYEVVQAPVGPSRTCAEIALRARYHPPPAISRLI